MSISNHYAKIQNIISEHNTVKDWAVIYFGEYFSTNEFDYQFIRINLQLLKNKLQINKIYFFVQLDLEQQKIFQLLVEEFGIIVNDCPFVGILSLIKNFLSQGTNIIMSNKLVCCNDVHQILKYKRTEIYSYFQNINFVEDSIYSNIGKKFGFTQYILSDLMVFTSNKNTANFIHYVDQVINKLETNDKIIAMNISFTIGNIKYGLVKDICHTDILQYLSIQSVDKLHEYFIHPELPIPYDDNNYIYYPCLDVESNRTKMGQELSTIFNTNGFCTPNIDINPTKYLSKKYDNKFYGLFVGKKNKKIIIPKILHHIWLVDEPITNYVSLWRRMLRSPWQYILWTEKEIMEMMDTRWKDLFIAEKNLTLKMIIVYLAILEKYGGFIVDSFSIPLKTIPDELLMDEFMVSFFNEFNFGTKLSYRIIASIPNHHLVDKLYQILVTNFDEERLLSIEKTILSNDSVFVCPSYYFQPNLASVPKKLLNNAICINLWKEIKIDHPVSIPPKRNYSTSSSSMLVKLKENPRNRLV